MQNHYNLLYREEEREMLPLARRRGSAWSRGALWPVGRLTRHWEEATERTSTDEFGKTLYVSQVKADRRVVERVGEVAEKRGVPRAQIALAWVLHKPPVTAPIVGASKVGHLEDAVAALALKLTPDELEALEEPYVPHSTSGFV